MREARAELYSLDQPFAPAGRLTPRELEVLELLQQHWTIAEIGSLLFVSRDTIKTHVRAVYSKLQVQKRSEAVAKARNLRVL